MRLVHVPEQRRGEDFAAALAGAMADLPPIARRTLTWDQGVEMARHDLLAGLFDEGVYFAHPGSPRQRGTNENNERAAADSISPSAPTFAASPSRTSAGSKTSSTTGPERLSGGPHPQPHSVHSCQNDQANVATTD